MVDEGLRGFAAAIVITSRFNPTMVDEGLVEFLFSVFLLDRFNPTMVDEGQHDTEKERFNATMVDGGPTPQALAFLPRRVSTQPWSTED